MAVSDEKPRQQFKTAVATDDRDAVDALLTAHSDLRASLDEPLFEGSKPALAAARTVETAKVILSHGAGLEKVGEWWASGFFVRSVEPDVGRFLAGCGAALTPHAAAGLGHVDELRAMLDADPAVIDTKGGDDCTPLHFARDVPVAALLVKRGARLDARDTDHNSTPAQWLVGDCPEVVRYLYKQGATPDIFVASALGDRELVEKLVAEDRRCLAWRVGKPPSPDASS